MLTLIAQTSTEVLAPAVSLAPLSAAGISPETLQFFLTAGPVVSFLLFITKKLIQKFGVESTEHYMVGGLFLLSLLAAVIFRYTPEDIWVEVAGTVATAITVYQLVYKFLWQSVLSKLFDDQTPPKPVKKAKAKK